MASVLSSGANFCANIIFPAIFSLPFMNADCGFNFPNARSTISASATVRVVSALPSGAPSCTLAFFKSSAGILMFINELFFF